MTHFPRTSDMGDEAYRDVAGPREAAVAALAAVIHARNLHADTPWCEHQADPPWSSCAAEAGAFTDHLDADAAAKAALAAWAIADAEPSCADCGSIIDHHADCPEGDGHLVWDVFLATPSTSTETPTRVVGGGEPDKDADAIVDLVERFISSLLVHDVPRRRVEDYGNDIVRLVRQLAATTPSVSDEGLRAALERLVTACENYNPLYEDDPSTVDAFYAEVDEARRALSSEPVR